MKRADQRRAFAEQLCRAVHLERHERDHVRARGGPRQVGLSDAEALEVFPR